MKNIKAISIILFYISLVFIFENKISAQDTIQKITVIKKMELHKHDLGLGLGLDYGGIIGAKCAFIPVPFLSVFGGVGIQLGGIGWNTGITWHILPVMLNHTFRPNIKIMYGINSSFYIEGKSEYNRQFTGFTPGCGLEMRFGRNKKHGMDVDLNFPLRTPGFWSHYNTVKNDPNVEKLNEPLPVAISIGYHKEF
jgi:hypothetical protein